MSEEVTFDSKMIALAASAAANACACGEGVVPAEASQISEGGSFTIPIIVPIGLESGDGRMLLKDSITSRDFPIPLLWQPKTGPGHDGSYIVGRIDGADITDEGLVNGYGVFDTGPWGREAERLVRNKFLRGVSVDLDMFEPVDEEEMALLQEKTGVDLSRKTLIKKSRSMAATLVAKPAFQECSIYLNEEDQETIIVDGVHTAEYDPYDDPETVVSTLIASAIPIKPPKEWFSNPKFKKLTALDIDEGGRVFGHIASWAQDHISFNNGTRPPRSKSNYAYFHTGLVRTAEEEDVAVGQLTLAGGHADLMASANEAVRHYDDTASAIADVHVGEDAFGIWVAGALRPGATPEQIRALRASAPSGDWRPIGRSLELVAICQVNVPGFPVARACVASGVVTALVAGGAGVLYQMKQEESRKGLTELENRLSNLERSELEKKKAELSATSSISKAREERKAALIASAAELRERFAPVLAQKEQEKAELAEKREALVSEFSLKYKGKRSWDEKLHPRDRHGKFRHVLGRLTDIFDGDDDSGATEAIRHAAESEDNGDENAAREAAREARVSLGEALSRVSGNAKKTAEIKSAIEEVDEAIEAGSGSNSALDDEIEEGLTRLIDFLIDELGEEVDPKTLIDRAYAQLKQYVDSSSFENPEDVVARIADIIEKRIKPNFMQ